MTPVVTDRAWSRPGPTVFRNWVTTCWLFSTPCRLSARASAGCRWAGIPVYGWPFMPQRVWWVLWFATVLPGLVQRSEENTSELQSLMRISYAVFCLKKKNTQQTEDTQAQHD